MKEFLRQNVPLPLRKALYRLRSGTRALVRSALFPNTRCQVRGRVIQLAVASELERFRASTYASKEPEMLDWLDQNLKDGDVLFDVGANIGLYSLYAAALKPLAQIYAFEPESQNFSRLCRNIVINGAKNIIPCNIPIADSEGFGYFYVGELIEGGSEHSFGEPSAFRPDPSVIALRQGMLSVSLDTLIDKYGLPQPTLLKIDVDGLEDKILQGSQKVLRSPLLRGLIVEFNRPPQTAQAPQVDVLRSLGFTLTGQSQWVYQSNGMQSQNYIFRRTSSDLVGVRP